MPAPASPSPARPPRPPRRAPRHRSGRAPRRVLAALTMGTALLAGAVAAGCGREPARGAGDGGAPRAEFLLAAGDSTYWVASQDDGIHVRASSMLLARVDGRLFEVYTTDEDRSFYDAVFTAQRIYRRDLLTGDSVAVWDDPSIARLAGAYAAAHPAESPLAPDEETSDDPRTVATSEVALVDVHGPYLSVEHRHDVDRTGERHAHSARRAVVDLRTGRRVVVRDLVGDGAAGRVEAEGRRRLAVAVDSVRAIASAAAGDAAEETARALRALGTLRFDPASFVLADVAGAPAVSFVVPGTDAEGRAVLVPLAPVAVPGPPPGWWTADVRGALPALAPDSSEARWPAGSYEVVARYAPDRDAATVLLHHAPDGDRPAAARGSWRVARVPAPVRQLVLLDQPPLAPGERRALARAFNESTLYGDDATTASWRSGATTPVRPAAVVRAGARASHAPAHLAPRRGARHAPRPPRRADR